MMKKVLSVILAMGLLIFATASWAEQLPSPTIQTTIKAEVTVSESCAVPEADFEVWLEADTEMSTMFLAEMQAFHDTEKIAHFFDDETWVLAAEYLPEDFDIEKLMLAEIYSMGVAHYDSEYGDVSATFEFAVEYEDEAILLAMVGVAINDNDEVAEGEEVVKSEEAVENDEAVEGEQTVIQWFPIQTTVSEGCVMLTLPQTALELISDNEPAYFVLLQEQV